MKAAFLAVAVVATAGTVFYFGTGVHAAKASAPSFTGHDSTGQGSATQGAIPSKSLKLPLFFEANQGQTASQVKFLARGSGYGLFLTSDEAVLQLRPSAISPQPSALSSSSAGGSVIRMRLDGANSTTHVAGASLLPGKSNYFIGNDPSRWRQNIPQFAQVEYQAVYPGVDLVYYGNEGQLEYDFRVAPGADPNQIALTFNGASAHLDEGDLVLSTPNGDVRFRAPHIYQPGASEPGNASSRSEKTVAGSFRQLADNKIGFAIGDYDRNRELVIDPTLTYSTYLGGSGTEGFVKVAVDSAGSIYLAGSTNSPDFPLAPAANSSLTGTQNIFISKVNPSPQGGASQLVYSIYLGGSKVDTLQGIAVDASFGIYVAGYTSSPDFPTANGFQAAKDVKVAGTHGFLSKLSNVSPNQYVLSYSTYLAGNGTDRVTGLAIDTGCNRQACNAYVTGDTTSSNAASDGFPANADGYQTVSNSPGNPQFFASKINTTGSGSLSMIYSTYFGGGNPVQATAAGGGIAVDQAASNANMYITGTTNMLPGGLNGGPGFPLIAAQQSCLNQASQTSCNGSNGGTNTDAFVAKIIPKAGSIPVYSTYLGGSGMDAGIAIAVDSSSNAYVTGSTSSTDWVNCTGFQCSLLGSTNAFIAKIGPLTGSVYPIDYFTYLGGTGQDTGQDIKVDSLQAVHVVGNTTSSGIAVNGIIPSAISSYDGSVYGGQGDAFVALIGTTLLARGSGDYLTYLGGNQLDQGTGIALDPFGATYVAGNTISPNFPTVTPFQAALNSNSQDAFVSRISAISKLEVLAPTSSPSPNPVNAGAQVAFTFDIINLGPDNASFVTFYATVPTGLGVTSQQAKVTGGLGNCTALQGNTITCNLQTLAVCTGTCTTGASVEVDVTPTISGNLTQISVSGSASANGGGQLYGPTPQTVPVVDFSVGASTSTPTINAGDVAQVQVNFCPTNLTYGYSGTITPSQTTSPSMVTSTTPTFSPTTASLAGTSCSPTTLSIPTVARPVTTGSLLRRGSFYATWLPIGGLSIIGLGLGVGRRRRRWLAGAVLCVIAGVVALQAGCGSSSTAVNSGGGTVAGTYIVTINGSAGSGQSHSGTPVSIRVN